MTDTPMWSPGITLTIPHPRMVLGRPSTSLMPSCSSHSAPPAPSMHLTLLPQHPPFRSCFPLPNRSSEAAQAWPQGCSLPSGNISSPPYPHQESDMGNPFFLALIATPPVTGAASTRAGPACGSPYLHPEQRRFSRGRGRSDLHESLWQGLEPE